MRLALNVGYWGMGIGREDQLAVVREAERLGFHSIWAAEASGAVRARLSAFCEVGVGTLTVIPMAFGRAPRNAQLRAVAELAG